MSHGTRWAVLIFLLPAAGCGTWTGSMKDVSVRTEGEPGIRFPAEGTYSWAIRPGVLAENSGVHRFAAHMRVRDTVERELARKGFEYRGAGYRVDFIVYYRVVLEDTLDADRLAKEAGEVKEGASSAAQEKYQRGCLIIDVYRPKTRKLLWRGIADAKIDPSPDVSEEAKLNRANMAVRMILARFPQK
jgi:hypothetical protein